jgi:Fic family protein
MHRPPKRSAPNILFAHGTSEWVRRVSEKHKQLASLKLTSGQRDLLERWTEIEFVHSSLALEGITLDRQQISQLISNEAVGEGDAPKVAAALVTSLRKVATLVRAKDKNAELTSELLLEIHGVSGVGLRKGPGTISGSLKPPAPNHLPTVLESAFHWYTAESFAELNPIEQAALVLLRLIEIQPFEENNQRTALVAASLFTLRGDLPPLIIKAQMKTEYFSALDEATRMNTKPMVELLAWAVADTLDESIQQVSRR